MGRWGRWSDTPGAVGLAAAAAGLVFVVARLAVVAHGHPSVFIVVGNQHLSRGSLPRGIAITAQSGYDGQFYYRMALDPVDFARSAFGIRFDTFSRLERIGYPAIAWILAAGQRSLIPATLIVTNVIALGALGLGGGLLARDSGRHAMWGLVLPGFSGYLWSASRDLTEITAAAFLALGLYCYRKDRSWPAGALLLGAVLSKETAVYVVLVIALTRVIRWVMRRDPRPPGTLDIAWGLPLVGFAAWQLVVLAGTGTLPLTTSGQANLDTPFTGAIDGLRRFLPQPFQVASLLWLGEFAVLAIVLMAAALSIRSSSVPLHERLAWVAVVILTICVAPAIWLGKVGFRSLDDVYLFSWIVLLGTSRRLWAMAAIVGVTWLVVAVQLVRFV